MNLSREDLIILTAAQIYGAYHNYTVEDSVYVALKIEEEVKRQRKAQVERRSLPSDFRDHLPSAMQYAKDRLYNGEK